MKIMDLAARNWNVWNGNVVSSSFRAIYALRHTISLFIEDKCGGPDSADMNAGS